MLYTFRGGNEYVKLRINRKAETFEISTSKTGYKFASQPYWKLFGEKGEDEEEAKREIEKTRPMNDEEFDKYLISAFQKYGYEFIKKL